MLGVGEELSGLPLEYILGESRRSTISEQHFYNLQAEETLSSLEATDISQAPPPQETSRDQHQVLQAETQKEKRENLRLDVDDVTEEKTHSSLIFSPGGNEAYVFSTAGLIHQDEDAAKSSVLKDVKSGQPQHNQPRGARPRTVGHADDSPNVKARSIIERKLLQGRLEALKTSLDFEADPEASAASSSAQASTEPSPRRYLPRIPPAEHDEVESQPSPSVTRRGGGAMSPSIASVASCSTTASGTDAQRLQWDNGADLGYYDKIMKQKEAYTKLDTLDKELMENYSKYAKRTEPEGKPSTKHMGRGQQLLNRLPGGTDHEEDLRQMRLNKFANSLLRGQRDAVVPQKRLLGQVVQTSSSKDSGVASNTTSAYTQNKVGCFLRF